MASEYTFYPKFSEFVTLYRGVVRVWIADGTALKPGTNGVLYAEYVDGLITELGYVSDYETAKEYFAELGIDLTYPEWVEILAKTPDNAKKSEAWAVGEINGSPVPSSNETYNNNARYYADQSKIWTTGKNLNNQSVQPKNNATYWNDEAHGWANNKEPGTYSETNNSKYYATLAGEKAADAASSAQDSETSKQAAISAQSSSEQARDIAISSKEAAQTAQAAAEAAKTKSKQAQANAETAQSNAEAAQSAAEASALMSEESRQASETAQTASEQARDVSVSAKNAAQAAQSAAETAKAGAESAKTTSDTRAKDSEAWAVGKRNGTDVPSSDVTYHNNSKYYAEQASASKTAAAGSATSANASAINAEKWATGDTGGTPSASNNAKYYSTQASNSASSASISASTATTQATNAASSASSASSSATTATNKAAEASNFASAAAGSASEALSYKNAAQSSMNLAAQWATGGTSGTPTSTNNSKYYAEQSKAESDKVGNMTVSAETLLPTAEATVAIQTVDSHYNLTFGIPKGDKGDPNYLALMPSGDGLLCTWTEDRDALSAKTIIFDPSAQTPVTIYDMIKSIKNSEIDALFS